MTSPTMPVDAGELAALVAGGLDAMAHGARADIERFVAPHAVNREAVAEPLDCRAPGPSGFFATAQWLRRAYSDLSFEVHEIVAAGDLVAVHCTMRGRHTGPFVTYRSDGSVTDAFPPTGRTFAVTHTHWLRFDRGLIVEHWANRDDIGQAVQLGWVPPTPMYLVRMALAKRRARRSSRQS
ncbi:MAG: ester cyclase [Acidimicrobiales bacterium]